jgi:hypothetical protein
MRRPSLRAAVALVAAAALVGGAAAVAAAQSAPSEPQISRSTDAVGGRTVVAWSAPFAEYLVERSRLHDCSRGQRGLVFFIPGTSGGNSRTSCTVSAAQPIMVSPAVVICTVPDRGYCTDTARINDVRRVRVTIDGQPVTVRQFDWVSRQAFRLKGQQASVAGYMYIIRGLTPGQHTIVASATFRNPAVRGRTTATVTVR